MTKELEALEHIYYGSQGYGETDKYYKYLKEYLEQIDNAKPSEALECLKHIKNDDFNMIVATYSPIAVYNGVSKNEMFDTIEQALLQAEKDKAKIEKLKQENTILHIELATFEKLLFKKIKGE